jgi:hypothetical protein
MKIIHKDDFMYIIGTPKETAILNKQHTYVSGIDNTTFRLVDTYVKMHKTALDNLMVKDDKGDMPYYEQDWHDRLVESICSAHNLNNALVSNSLSALGY